MQTPITFKKNSPRNKPVDCWQSVLVLIKGRDYNFYEVGHYDIETKLWHVNRGPSQWDTYPSSKIIFWCQLPSK